MSSLPKSISEINTEEINASLIKIIAKSLIQKKVTFVIVASIEIAELETRSKIEQELKEIKFDQDRIGNRIDWLRNDPDHFSSLYNDLPQYSKDYIYNIFSPVPNIMTRRGRMNLDHKSKYVNITNGFRHTTCQPKKYDHSIFVVGGSGVYGYGCEDKHTLPSSLQLLINNSKALSTQYSVFNLGARGSPPFVDLYKLLNLKTRSGDIVVFQGVDKVVLEGLAHLRSEWLHCIFPDFSEREKEEEVFFDKGHVTYQGHYILAQKIYSSLFNVDTNQSKRQANKIVISKKEKIEAFKVLESFSKDFTELYSNIEIYPELRQYIDEIQQLNHRPGITGAVVVNCNPLTLGHKYFIEHAAKQVDNLFVFVVEEDLSYFNFKTRYGLVVEETKNMDNVRVVRSGKFVMSTTTYPEYFSKDEEMSTSLNATLDLDIFGEYIGPALNISIRFIGKETNCKVTEQHNLQMQNILPTYGIRVEEIERIKQGENDISASLVRKYMASGEIEKVKPFVPLSTLNAIKILHKGLEC